MENAIHFMWCSYEYPKSLGGQRRFDQGGPLIDVNLSLNESQACLEFGRLCFTFK